MTAQGVPMVIVWAPCRHLEGQLGPLLCVNCASSGLQIFQQAVAACLFASDDIVGVASDADVDVRAALVELHSGTWDPEWHEVLTIKSSVWLGGSLRAVGIGSNRMKRRRASHLAMAFTALALRPRPHDWLGEDFHQHLIVAGQMLLPKVSAGELPPRAPLPRCRREGGVEVTFARSQSDAAGSMSPAAPLRAAGETGVAEVASRRFGSHDEVALDDTVLAPRAAGSRDGPSNQSAVPNCSPVLSRAAGLAGLPGAVAFAGGVLRSPRVRKSALPYPYHLENREVVDV
jgi:hypothetical protein